LQRDQEKSKMNWKLLLFSGTCFSAHGWQVPSVKLTNGVEFPMIGFGTAGGIDRTVIKGALDLGYTLFDTAQATEWYKEGELGESLLADQRKKIFIISKLHPRDHGYYRTLGKFEDSLKNIRTDYLDGFLLHYPHCWPELCGQDHVAEGTWKDSWRAMEELYAQKKIRALGVSNFDLSQLKELVETVAKVKPHFIQNYFDPWHQDREVREYCRDHNILYQGYSTLGTQWQNQGLKTNPILSDSTIAKIKEQRPELDEGQIVLRWAIDNDVAVIPRTSSIDRARTNLNLDFKLNPGQMRALYDLNGVTPINVDNQPDHDPDLRLVGELDLVVKNHYSFDVAIFWESDETEFDSYGGAHSKIFFSGEIEAKGDAHHSTHVGHKFIVKKVDRGDMSNWLVLESFVVAEGETHHHIGRRGEL